MSISFSGLVQKARPRPNHATTNIMNEVLKKLPVTTLSALPNNFRVACEENPNSKFATVGVWMDFGSKYDDRHLSGAAKMLELCSFEGTNNQDRTKLANAIEELGGHIHYNTGREHSYVYIKCAKENAPKAVGVLADLVRNARCSDEDVAAAKQKLLAQQATADENVDQMIMDNLHTCAYDSTDKGLGNSILGNEKTVKNMKGSDLKQFRDTHFKANRMVLVGTGGVDHTKLEKAAADAFGDMATESQKPKIETRYIGGDYRLWNLRFKTAHMAWGFETCGANCADTVPLTLATHIHGSYHRSQQELGQHVAHRVMKIYSSMDFPAASMTHFPHQCIETANSFSHFYEDNGLVGMHIVGRPYSTGPGGPADSMDELLYYTMWDWCRMTQKVIGNQEFEQAKVNYKAQLLFNQDGATNAAEDIGRQVLYHGRRIPLEDMYNRIDDVTMVNMQETLQHYYYARRPVFSFGGYIYIIPNYDWISNWTWKFWY